MVYIAEAGPRVKSIWNVHFRGWFYEYDFPETPDIWPNMNTQLSVKFEGTEGWVYVDDGGNVDAMPKSLLEDIKFEKQQWTDAANWQGHHRNFLDCVKTRAQTIASAEAAHRSTTTCHVANICLRLGRSLNWNS
ncbi:MAG: hypothetical protein ABIF19_12120 [Planctomycetota bacterium]